MKEILIRIGCVFFGVLVTLSIVFIVRWYLAAGTERVIVTEIPIEEDDVLSENIEIYADYGLEEEILKSLRLPDKKTFSGNETENLSVSENNIDEVTLKWMNDYPKVNSDKALEQKMEERSSYEETLAINAFDKEVIANNTVDFSNIKISILGDSITTGVELEDPENNAYPAVLKDILGCEEIVNLGKGGSAVSRAGNYAMVERWSDIEKDSDIIIVFGGSNDCIFETEEQFGYAEYDQRMIEGTFCGDLDEMASAIETEYRAQNEENHPKLLYINPPSTIQNGGVYDESHPEEVVHQSSFAKAINTIVPEYGFEVIDLYNNNILNSHDKDVNEQLVPDGIHPNEEGHLILAEHIASQIIQRIEQ